MIFKNPNNQTSINLPSTADLLSEQPEKQHNCAQKELGAQVKLNKRLFRLTSIS